MAILYVAADGDELKPFARHLSGCRKLKWPIDYAFEGILDGRRILLAANGAGPKLAAQAVEVAIRAVTAAELSSSRLEGVVSVGFCGALTEAGRDGEVIWATEVLEHATGRVFPCAAIPECAASMTGRIISRDRIAVTTADKLTLASSGALAIDMEASGVAARAERAGLPFLCVKVISDRLDESFRFDLNAMRTPDGRIARGKIVLYAVTHPWLLPELLHLRQRADRAAKALGDFLVSCRISFGQSSPQGEVVTRE